MNQAPSFFAHLEAFENTRVEDLGWRALSNEPWLRICGVNALHRGGFLEISYRGSHYDDPIRPILRFQTSQGSIDAILPGPTAGAAAWRGYIPADCHDILINPCARIGRFDFVIESLRQISLADRLSDVRRRRPGKLFSIAAALIFNYRQEALNALNWGGGADSFASFPQWLDRYARKFDIKGIDSPRSDWTQGPQFFVVVSDEGDQQAAAAAHEALIAQIYPNFTIVSSLCEALQDATPHPLSFIIQLKPGDLLAPHALALFAEEIMRFPETAMVYADEIELTDQGMRPVCKPNWSPILQQTRPYVGCCCAWRADIIDAAPSAPNQWMPASSSEKTIRHLRRFLLTRPACVFKPPQNFNAVAPSPQPMGKISIILLTRDRADLLGPCLQSLFERTSYPDYEVLIVDNDTRRLDARKILSEAAQRPNVRILSRPGPFNFAAFNNEAVEKTSGGTLVFLNNDTEILTQDWLERLRVWTLEPGIGAVGPLLLFPDHKVQHAGVVLGIGEDAGHFEAFQSLNSPSWLDRLAHVHEVSAVTGACMMLSREKFIGAGGFDAKNLPIEFNDIDLCLRLADRGWKNLYIPEVRLLHKESASRGNAKIRPMSVYGRERAYFKKRWISWIRDDPYYHPAFSLYSRIPALNPIIPEA